MRRLSQSLIDVLAVDDPNDNTDASFVLQTGALQNIFQTNCPTSAPCSTAGGCSCPHDLLGDTGVLINQFTGYQCAYPGGACTWDFVSIAVLLYCRTMIANTVLLSSRAAFCRTPRRRTVSLLPSATRLVSTTRSERALISGCCNQALSVIFLLSRARGM